MCFQITKFINILALENQQGKMRLQARGNLAPFLEAHSSHWDLFICAILLLLFCFQVIFYHLETGLCTLSKNTH